MSSVRQYKAGYEASESVDEGFEWIWIGGGVFVGVDCDGAVEGEDLDAVLQQMDAASAKFKSAQADIEEGHCMSGW